jgi:hypothetical protein
MMTIAEAVHKAVQEGYHVQSFDGGSTSSSGVHGHYAAWTRKDHPSSLMVTAAETFLDPAFWQALGCALEVDGIYPHGDWKILWHDFIEHLIDGGTAEGFFETIASPSMDTRKG